MILHRKSPLRFIPRHCPARSMTATAEALRVALAAHDKGARPHAAGNDSQIALPGPHRALARDQHVLAEMLLSRHVIVMAVDRLQLRLERRDRKSVV